MDVAQQHMLSARAHGGDIMDWTALVGGQRISAGLQPFAGKVGCKSIELCLFLGYSCWWILPADAFGEVRGINSTETMPPFVVENIETTCQSCDVLKEACM